MIVNNYKLVGSESQFSAKMRQKKRLKALSNQIPLQK